MNDGISFEEYLDRYGTLVYTNVGVSMLPLMRQGKDLFIVRKKGTERCRKGDVVLFRRPPDKYVLHRIIDVREKEYILLGDNCLRKEYGIRDDDIIGVMTAFVRNGKEHSISELPYRVYSTIWVHMAPVRVFAKRTAAFLKRKIK